jgi:glycosidase
MQVKQIRLNSFRLSGVFLLIALSAINLLWAQAKDESSMKTKEMRKPRAKEFVPVWAKSAVWYQIFPERFRNGDKSNDPKLENIKGSWPHDSTSPWQIHPWTSDWYELQTYEKKNGKDIWFNIQRRRYGGDIQGIFVKLDYLQDLGVNAIYLNPVFDAPSLHKYDGATYHHIDPNFGPDPEGDRKIIASETPDDPSTWQWTSADKLMLKLIREVHRRNMKIIFDGVFNHMGINSFAFKDVQAKQQNSRFKDWFTIKSWDDPKNGTKFDYEGWFGVRELPELREDENGIVKGPKDYIFAATRRWMDPEQNGNLEAGIDGWRLDVAFCIKHGFWKDWRKLVKSINDQAYLTAEVIDSISVIKPYLKGDEFDAVMNYNFAFASSEFFINQKDKITASEFDRRLKKLRSAFAGGVQYVQQNLFDSHDTHRLGSHVANPDIGLYRAWADFFEKSKGSNPKYNTSKPTEEQIKIQKLCAIFQMTYLGAPMIYYGDEAGMWGANDPDCRKPMLWDDMTYSEEVFLPDQTKKKQHDKVEFNKDLFSHYKKLISLRNANPALQLGDYKTLLTDDGKELYGFSRSYKGETIFVVLNNSNSEQTVSIPVKGKVSYKDEMNSGSIYDKGKGKIKLTIPAKWGSILIPVKEAKKQVK